MSINTILKRVLRHSKDKRAAKLLNYFNEQEVFLILKVLGGKYVYLPKPEIIEKKWIHRSIVKKLSKSNDKKTQQFLSREFGIPREEVIRIYHRGK